MKIIDSDTRKEIGEMEYHRFELGARFRIPTEKQTFYFQVMGQDPSAVYVKPLTREEYNMTETPEPIQAWVKQQTDLSPVERDEFAADLEGYFRKRKARIQSENLGGE